MSHRAVCLSCLRPQSVCYCRRVTPIPSRTRVVFLQHPRERRMPVGTARMARLSLPNSELHVGVSFSAHPRVQQLLADPESRAAVLFPGPGATDPAQWKEAPPRTLIVLDGTWPQARKVWKSSPALHALPRIAFQPTRPSNYRIRREPSSECVSTIEAVAEVLGQLEGDPERFAPMLLPFGAMVDAQLAYRERRVGPPRRRSPERVAKKGAYWASLLEVAPRLVLVYAEANAYPKDSDPHFPPELVQLAAYRVDDGRSFHALLRPRNPLAEAIPNYLGLPRERFAQGEDAAAALARFRAFAGAKDVLAAWGPFSLSLLAGEGLCVTPHVDLRKQVRDVLHARPSSLEDAGAQLSPGAVSCAGWQEIGRAGRRLEALRAVHGAWAAAVARKVSARGAKAHRPL